MSKSKETMSVAAKLLAEDPKLREDVRGTTLFDQFVNGPKKLKTLTIDDELFYVVEGDTLLDEDQLAIYAAQREKADEAFVLSKRAGHAGLGTSRLSTPQTSLIALDVQRKDCPLGPEYGPHLPCGPGYIYRT